MTAGLISAEQADAIRAAEGPPPPRQRISFVVEILGYLGGILATVAVLMLMGDVWAELTPMMQIGALFIATGAFVAGGAALRGHVEPAIERLAGFLWLAAVATYAGGLFLLGTEVFALDNERPIALFTGVISTTLAAPLWIARRKAMQQMALFLPIATAVVYIPPDGFDEVFGGWTLAAFGLVWFVLSQTGTVRPERTGDVLGAGAVYTGLQVVGFDDAFLLGVSLFVMAAIVVVGVTRERMATLAVGAVALLILVPQFITELFGPSLGATGAIAVVGLLIVAAAVFMGRRRTAED